jgi:parvulin-like peptidyl-prolyl isomerase
VPIRVDDHARLVAGLERDTREAASGEMRERVLDRMIDEELLVQRALDLGLAQVDRRVRANLVSAMITSVTADVDADDPDADELREFFEQEQDFFTQPGRVRVGQVFFRVRGADGDAEVEPKAELAAQRLAAGEALERVRAELGDDEVSPIPDVPLPPQKLLEYLGPTATRQALELDVGDISEPVRSGTGYHVLKMIEREPARVPDYENVAELVRAEWARRQGDRALRGYLDDLRSQAEIVR